ncbi:MAG: nucleotidyltransferase family protein [Prevotella sp.]|nr:nucleotidyltransferase family protein [Prevotella sp.]
MTEIIADYFRSQPVNRAWLFGSFARGEETADSDVDILIQFDHSTPIGMFRYARMHREMEDLLGRKVDLVEDGTLRPAASLTANKDRKIIYERAKSGQNTTNYTNYTNFHTQLKDALRAEIKQKLGTKLNRYSLNSCNS